MKIVVYGRFESGKYALAMQLVRDNPFLGQPVIITDVAGMRRFLSSPESAVGIVYAETVRLIMSRYSKEKFGTVLFVAAPGEIEAQHQTDCASTVEPERPA